MAGLTASCRMHDIGPTAAAARADGTVWSSVSKRATGQQHTGVPICSSTIDEYTSAWSLFDTCAGLQHSLTPSVSSSIAVLGVLYSVWQAQDLTDHKTWG